MKSIEIQDLESLFGGIMEHPDCQTWFEDYLDAVSSDQFNAAYGIVIKMYRGGCSKNPYDYL